MRVRVFARADLEPWVTAEGFEFHATIESAAAGADVISPHLGLGPASADGFANAGLIGANVFDVLAPNAMLINYDRGELVDVAALDAALECRQLRCAAIDADIFVTGGKVSGPLAPYLPLLTKHTDRLQLLPHAAADTDHPSRVAGALQAMDQMVAAIRYGVVANPVGAVPEGYSVLGPYRLPGIGAVAPRVVADFVSDTQRTNELREQLATLTDWLGATASQAQAADNRSAVLAANRLVTQLRQAGLIGPGRNL